MYVLVLLVLNGSSRRGGDVSTQLTIFVRVLDERQGAARLVEAFSVEHRHRSSGHTPSKALEAKPELTSNE